MVSLSEFVKLPLRLLNQTDTSAHLGTKYQPATYTELDTVPSVVLPENFWTQLIRFDSDDRVFRSEAHVTQFNLELIQSIMKGLGIDCKVAPQVQNMDIQPDLSFFFSKNILQALNWEDKKGIGDKMWDNESAVAGQVFEQLILTKASVGGAAYGIQSTYNGVRLVSTENWSDHLQLESSPPAVLPQNAATPEKCLPSFPPIERPTVALQENSSTPSRKSSRTKPKKGSATKVSKVPKIPVVKNAPEDRPKKTRITERITHLGMKREFFVSKVHELGIKDAIDMEEKNKAVIQLLCAALLLAQESTKSPKVNLQDKPFMGVCRMFNLGQEPQIYPDSVRIEDGIQFDQCPSEYHKKFCSLAQVGSGATAVCCLAVAADASICALKIFRKTTARNQAEEELGRWKTIYERKHWTFMRVAEVAGTHILVLPFFNVPGNAEERAPFLEGKSRRDTGLWKALDHFASRGYAHNDLKWHHVGTFTSTTKKRKHDTGNPSQTEFFLLDLGDVTKKDDLLDLAKRTVWVKAQFEMMKDRHLADIKAPAVSSGHIGAP